MVAINWQYSINGQMVHPTDEVLADWNYYADVTVSASVSLSISDAKEKLGLGPYARVCWVLIARSTGTPVITRSVPRVAVNGAQEIPLRIPASSLGGTLSVELVLSLLSLPPQTPAHSRRLKSAMLSIHPQPKFDLKVIADR